MSDAAAASRLRVDRPHPARVYDYLLGGKDNYASDRAAAEESLRTNPNGRVLPRVNRAFLRRVVRYLAEERGIRQFLDIGTGIPTSPNVHEVAQAAVPEARVVYVDNDPIVLAHARALFTGTQAGRTAYIDADLRDIDAILGAPELRDTLDLREPVGLLLFSIMHFIADEQDPAGIVGRLLDPLPPGSYLAVSHLTGDLDPGAWQRVTDSFRERGLTMRVRSKSEIERFFAGLELLEPGVGQLQDWHPDAADVYPPDLRTDAYGGVARKR
ncbi:SAM-dependent methyltransferase [Streptomyces boninensis]|uniref:SAM-dependent methyltransferase n=1 Tax=Streptomyces boninensis TaxID=2039455 RepID=UPI003B215A3D